jgi:hypothetical protein
MTTLNAIVSNDRGCSSLLERREPTALDLLIALNAVNVIGPQMFERDCLGCTFDNWRQTLVGTDVPADEHFTAADVLSDIADIRSLTERYPDIAEVDPELLDAAQAIETFVCSRMPSMH